MPTPKRPKQLDPDLVTAGEVAFLLAVDFHGHGFGLKEFYDLGIPPTEEGPATIIGARLSRFANQ